MVYKNVINFASINLLYLTAAGFGVKGNEVCA